MVPIQIKAREIEGWSTTIDARSRLPVLLRRLVHATGQDLTRVDFPGFDNAQDPGPDGIVVAGTATPWIPKGRSFWEFGTNARPKAKAEKDYAASLKKIDAGTRAAATFVFVTPRNWRGKNAWKDSKRAACDWADVRALDASDLERWLEQAPSVAVWLAGQLGHPTTGLESLDHAWTRWADATDPPLPPELFAPSLRTATRVLLDRLSGSADRPIRLAADSRDEALAFLACVLRQPELRRWGDRAVIVTTPDALRWLAKSRADLLPIVTSEDAARELPLLGARPVILWCGADASRESPDLTPQPLGHQAFEHALATIGIIGDRADQLARESARSPTILRRRLARDRAIAAPPWAGDHGIRCKLVPIALVGAWCAAREADRLILERVAGRDAAAVEADLTALLALDDSPVWSIADDRGVISRLDSLLAVMDAITRDDLQRLLEAARTVLDEPDPALELPEEKRWAAAVYGKDRARSDTLRAAIAETLVLLAVHGHARLHQRTGVDVAGAVEGLVRNLLTPLTPQRLASLGATLRALAEAAPGTLLEVIEEDLRSDTPVVPGLLTSVDRGGLFASPRHVHLLWSLELLAWNPRNLRRVVLILARLAEAGHQGGKKPIDSLQAIFRCWMPQTAASWQERIDALELLAERHPAIAWQVAAAQFADVTQIGTYSVRPRWRDDASGKGEPVTAGERFAFQRAALDLMLAWPSHDASTLGDLVERVVVLPDADRQAVWKRIDAWAATAADEEKAALRDRIHSSALSWRRRFRNVDPTIIAAARSAHDRLQPADVVIRHRWLLANSWIDVPADAVSNSDKLDGDAHAAAIKRLREAALAEIWRQRGFAGVEALLAIAGAAPDIGRTLARVVTDIDARVRLARSLLASSGSPCPTAQDALRGLLAGLPDTEREDLLDRVTAALDADALVRLLVAAPFRAATWRRLDRQDPAIRARYWREVMPVWGADTPEELALLIDGLLDAGRPTAAFHAVRFRFDDIDTGRLNRLLHAIATTADEPGPIRRVDAGELGDALGILARRPDVGTDELAPLEWAFVEALDQHRHGIPNLERRIAENPAGFVHLLMLSSRRSDDAADPPGLVPSEPAEREAAARRAFRVLERLRRIPGTRSDGTIDAKALAAWIEDVRRRCAACARAEIGDVAIGQLLARAPADPDGTWPCGAGCDVLEQVGSDALGRGLHVGAYNARGVVARGEGGGQERALAARCREWADARRFTHPFTATILDRVAKTCEREAVWWDHDATVRRRLGP